MDLPRISGSGALRSLGVAPAARTRPTQSPSSEAREAERPVAVAPVSAGGSAPVQAERVAEIRKAIEEGRYPIVPTEIADALIAAGLYGVAGK